jgi:hypothetical protein
MARLSEIAGSFVDRLRGRGVLDDDLDQPGLFEPGGRRVVLVTILGVGAQRIDEVLDRALAVLPGGDLVVFLTDRADFRPFRRRRLPFEYLPPPALRSGREPADWARYLAARYELLLAKWRPARVVSYGDSVAAFIGRTAPGRMKTEDSAAG